MTINCCRPPYGIAALTKFSTFPSGTQLLRNDIIIPACAITEKRKWFTQINHLFRTISSFNSFFIVIILDRGCEPFKEEGIESLSEDITIPEMTWIETPSIITKQQRKKQNCFPRSFYHLVSSTPDATSSRKSWTHPFLQNASNIKRNPVSVLGDNKLFVDLCLSVCLCFARNQSY